MNNSPQREDLFLPVQQDVTHIYTTSQFLKNLAQYLNHKKIHLHFNWEKISSVMKHV